MMKMKTMKKRKRRGPCQVQKFIVRGCLSEQAFSWGTKRF